MATVWASTSMPRFKSERIAMKMQRHRESTKSASVSSLQTILGP